MQLKPHLRPALLSNEIGLDLRQPHPHGIRHQSLNSPHRVPYDFHAACTVVVYCKAQPPPLISSGLFPVQSAIPELHKQLAFTTSSSKKRKLSRNQFRDDQISSTFSSADTVLPSCEPNDDPAFSFSAASTDGRSTPTYIRSEFVPASSLPARLQTASLVSADYTSSTASSPCGVADLSLDSDRGGDISGPETGAALASDSARSRSPFNVSRRAIMTSDANPHQRSSSPLKRRASSMDPDADVSTKEDAEMTSAQPTEPTENAENAPSVSKTHLPRAMSVDLPDNTANEESRALKDKDAPPLQEQIKTIQTLLKAFNDDPPKVGAIAYIVSRSWVEKALALGGDAKFAKKDVSDGPLGPVDNSDLILEVLAQPNGEEFLRMKPGTSLEECELFPEDAWTLVSEWYGVKDGQKPIVRRAINTAPDSASPANIVFELNPPVFRVHRLWSLASPIEIDDKLKTSNPPLVVLARSATTPCNAFYKELKELTGVSLDRKMRVWQMNQKPSMPTASSPSALTPPDSPSPDKDAESSVDPWQHLLLNVLNFTKVDRSDRVEVPAVDNTTNPNYNGKAPVSLYGLTQDMTLVIDEEIARQKWVSNYVKGRDEKAIPSRGSASSLTTQGKSTSGRNSPALGMMTRGRTQKKPGRGLGAVGLQNLGNTCYMNSALQCVRSVEELTKYFLTNEYVKEINKANPLGYKGQVAMAYGNLLKEIYAEARGAVNPRDFKNTVGRARSTFQGWGQQDTQEFLGFLLDALQEDLSRIKKKPYIEKPDSTDEMIGNEEAIRKMAEEVWDITRKRDDSVVADLFTGLYKSTLKCPVCSKISITFDPFSNLTLPLPVEDMWSQTVKFLPLNDAPVQIEVELPKHSAIEQLKMAVSENTGVPPELLLGAEEFKGKFFKIYDDNNDVSDEIQTSDIPTFHELEMAPTNFPPPKPKMGTIRSMLDISDEPYVDPLTERMVVTVLHRKRGGTSYRVRDEVVSPPHFIVLTPDEARNEDAIRRKILEKVATFSTWSEFSDNDDSTDADMVITSQSDADSSGDNKVVSHSVEGEDDLVDVSMVAGGHQPNGKQPLKQFNTSRPKWVNINTYLPPQLQNLFELSYFRENGDSPLPTGWNSVDDSKSFRTLASRAPELATEQDSNSPGSTNGADSERESVSEEQSPRSIEEQTRMADESEEEEPVRAPLKPGRGRGNHKVGGARRKFNKGTKTYGKKSNKRRNKEVRNSKEQSFQVVDVAPQPSPLDDVPGGPLVRLGEGIVVDWTEDSWDIVFGKDSPDDNRGSKTFVDPEKLRDPVLEQKRKTRMARKKQGITLDECLDEFEKAEVLSEQDMWFCPRCKEHRRASKKFDLWKTPDILIVHLKRFSNAGWRRDKLDVLVDFPIEGLDLHKRVLCQETGREEVYDLIAVDDHFGGLGGGHYTAYGRNFVDGQWYNYNDTSVSKTSPESVITRAAYLLFYRRRSDSPLGGPRFKEIFDKFDKGGEDEEEDESDSGEDQRLAGGSSLAGSSRLGTGAEVTLLRGNRGLASNTMSTANCGDNELPPYDGSSSTNVGSENIQNSIEDEGLGMTDNIMESTGFQATQTWNWNSLSSNDPTNSLGMEGYASDDAQPDSSEERDHDTDMQFNEGLGRFDEAIQEEAPPPPDFTAQIKLSEIQSAVWDKNKDKVMRVPADEGSIASAEAAEIHLDDEADQRPARP